MSTIDFKNSSRQVWREIREGTPYQQPVPETNKDYSKDFYGINEEEDIDYDSLADFIFASQRDSSLVFDWKKFAKKPDKKWVKVKTSDGLQDRLMTLHNTIPFKYVNDDKIEVTTTITGKINRRIDYLENYWLYHININPKDKKFELSLKILYDNTKQFLVDATDTIEENDYRIDEKYVAVILKATNIIDYIYLVKDTVGKEHIAYLKDFIVDKYCKKIKEEKDASNLVFLYENAPDFVLKQLFVYMDDDALFKHLDYLSNYDDKGLLHWFNDSGGAIINCLKSFWDSSVLFNKFSNDLAFVKRIFYNLDGASNFNGTVMSNRLIFASLLNAIALLNSKDKATKDKFYSNGNYKIGSNAVFEDKTEKEQNKFYLNQQKINFLVIAFPTGTVNVITYDTNVNDGAYYDPFDFVLFVEYKDDKEVYNPVIALLAKAIAQEKEVKEIQFFTRIGLDVLAIIVGLATLGTGAAVGIALLEVGLGIADIFVAVNEDELSKTEEGKAFLEAYNAILLTTAAFAAPEALQSVFNGGSSLIRTAMSLGKINYANAIKTCLLKVLLEVEIANFTKSSIKIVEPTELFYGLEYRIMAQRMTENGVLFVSGKKEGELLEYYAVIYKGEVIEEFTTGTKNRFANRYWRFNNPELVELLEELYKNGGVPFLKGFNREKILKIPKGQRPNPSVYLPKEYIQNNLKLFDEGASYLVPKSVLDKYGRELIGRADGQFVMSGKEMDALLFKAEGKISYIKKELGIPERWWNNEDIVRIDVLKPKKLNISIPSGNESGVNELWLPGGKLPKGYLEAVLNAIPKNLYKETKLNLR